jgi:hypothetical protein
MKRKQSSLEAKNFSSFLFHWSDSFASESKKDLALLLICLEREESSVSEDLFTLLELELFLSSSRQSFEVFKQHKKNMIGILILV